MAAVGVATEPAGLGLAPTAARARRPHGAARRPIGRRRLVERHVTTIFEKLDLTLSETLTAVCSPCSPTCAPPEGSAPVGARQSGRRWVMPGKRAKSRS
jgi:hypothetical protein